MSIELLPLGTKCNLSCDYCHQTKDASLSYDINAMIAMAAKTNERFGMFGGEPLLVPIPDLEKIFKYNSDRFGRASIQTNGTLITKEHIDLFRKYGVGVGISLDGRAELNAYRCDEKTTQKVIDSIEEMSKQGIRMSAHVVVHKLNGAEANIDRLIEYLIWLSTYNINYVTFHPLQTTAPKSIDCALTEQETIEAFVTIARHAEMNKSAQYQPFVDIRNMIHGNKKDALCWWNNCDPLFTRAVYGIASDCSIQGCTRMAIDGEMWLKSDSANDERKVILSQIAKDKGGCRACKYWGLCTGGCPAEAIDGDWRNKTQYCNLYQVLFQFYQATDRDAQSRDKYEFLWEQP
jgi:uncharacterized protein